VPWEDLQAVDFNALRLQFFKDCFNLQFGIRFDFFYSIHIVLLFIIIDEALMATLTNKQAEKGMSILMG
jgi:hypothetical protein